MKFIYIGCCAFILFRTRADVAELADALDSKSGIRKDVWVRPPPSAPPLASFSKAVLFSGMNTQIRFHSKSDIPTKPLWHCPKCSRSFANRNQSHFCGSLRDLEAHFRGKPRAVKRLFQRLRASVRACGPVTVLSEQTRIAFHVRMSFMAISVQERGLRGHFVFAKRLPHPRFLRIDTFSPRNHVHHFRLTSPEMIDAEFIGWIREAYAVGQQCHRRRA